MHILSCLMPDIRKMAGYIIIFNINKGIKGISETFLSLPPVGDTNFSLGSHPLFLPWGKWQLCKEEEK